MAKKQALFIYFCLVLIWSTNWTVLKLILDTVPVYWANALRYEISTVFLFSLFIITKKIALPKRHDLLGIIVIGFFQMTLMGLFMNIGVSYTSVGRSSILAYSMPLWITPIAYFYLKEPIHKFQIIGVIFGLIGIAILFNPFAERTNPNEVLGSSLLIFSSMLWAIVITFIKKYSWQSTPLQLSVWQNLLAAIITTFLALYFEGTPSFELNATLGMQLLFLGILATAGAFWASTVISQYLPAVVNSLGLLAVPVASMMISTFYLGESIDIPLMIASLFIIGGIVLGFIPNLLRAKKL